MTETISSLKFTDLVHHEKLPLLIKVYADNCQPCQEIAPVVDALAGELAGLVRIVKINRDEARKNGGEENPLIKLIAETGTQGIPALMLFENGKYIETLMGGGRSQKNIVEWMEERLHRKLTAPFAREQVRLAA